MMTVITGDVRDVLPTLASDSVHCVVTSPPYYGLRDYGTGQWEGGDAGCSHVERNTRGDTGAGTHNGGSLGFHGGSGVGPATQYRDICGKCGARRIDKQIGLEATPDEWVQTMVEVFREVRRVLRDDGTCWVNVGDSYNANQGSGFNGNAGQPTSSPRMNTGLAPKQLLMMPARLALALQADGWWLRSDIIWAKPNPMPESVTDRPTSAHEHVLLLAKRSRYYFDADAVREQSSENTHQGYASNGAKTLANDDAVGVRPSSFDGYRPPNRNCRNVWAIATEAFPESHFATYPTALVERCIRAGTSERGCCAQCGKPWCRETQADYQPIRHGGVYKNRGQHSAYVASNTGQVLNKVTTTTGWRASCSCGTEETRPCTVLDPFAGAGTTLLVADRLQRDSIGIELSPTYADMARNRITRDCPLFSSWAPAEPPEDARMADLFREAAD